MGLVKRLHGKIVINLSIAMTRPALVRFTS